VASHYWADFSSILRYVPAIVSVHPVPDSFPQGLALWEFNKRRIQFSQLLKSNTSLTLSRYFRLMALAMTEMFSTTPLAIFVIYLNATTSEIGPWRSWDDTHFDYFRVNQYPSVLWHLNHQLVISMELTRWVAPFSALVFFGFFGFAQEAQKQYRTAYFFVAKYLKFLPGAQPKSSRCVFDLF